MIKRGNVKLTANEFAKMELWDQITSAMYDGIDSVYGSSDMTDKEKEEVEYAILKKQNALYNYMGIEKIYDKLQKG